MFVMSDLNDSGIVDSSLASRRAAADSSPSVLVGVGRPVVLSFLLLPSLLPEEEDDDWDKLLL